MTIPSDFIGSNSPEMALRIFVNASSIGRLLKLAMSPAILTISTENKFAASELSPKAFAICANVASAPCISSVVLGIVLRSSCTFSFIASAADPNTALNLLAVSAAAVPSPTIDFTSPMPAKAAPMRTKVAIELLANPLTLCLLR
jgi:hypothetical protein